MLPVGTNQPATMIPLQTGEMIFALVFWLFLLAVLIGFLLIVAASPFLLLYGGFKILFSDEVQGAIDKADEKFVEVGMDVKKATESPEGQAALSVLEGAAEHYRESEGLDTRDTTSTTTSSTSTTSTSTTSDNPSQSLDPVNKDQLETEIRKQGVDPYSPAHDTDIEELLEDIEEEGPL